MTESLDAIMAGRDANASAPQVEDTSTAASQGRDEQGRFAPKQEAEPTAQEPNKEATPQQEPVKPAEPEKPPGMVPQQALHASRQREKAMERELAEIKQMLSRQQPAQQAPQVDPLAQFVADPKQFFQEQANPLSQGMTELREMVLELHASQRHGAEKVAAAKQAAEEFVQSGDPSVAAFIGRLQNSPNAFDELVKWNAEREWQTKIGNDPEAYINAEVERRLAAMSQQQQPAAAQPTTIPPSFAAGRSAPPRQNAQFDGPRPLSEIMKR